jgi:hypothetical protein
MGVYNHTRVKVVTKAQHIYDHALADFAYSHPSIPDVIQDAEAAMDWVFNALYPNTKEPVATPADLPTGVDTPNIGDLPPTLGDERIVQDDGDGKAAKYKWVKNDDMVAAAWVKVADMDWGQDDILSGLLDQTLWLYPRKYGNTDYDSGTELPLTGDMAGQHFYGGDLANQHLTLHANNGDDPGVHTGFVQVDDNFRPFTDLEHSSGTATRRWLEGYYGTLVVGTATMTITSDGTTGSITDNNGVITFGTTNLNTTGTFASGVATITGSVLVTDGAETLTTTHNSITSTLSDIGFGSNNLVTTGNMDATSLIARTGVDTLTVTAGTIQSTIPTIDFGTNSLLTTGTITAGALVADQLDIDDVRIDGNAISITTLNTDLALSANGTGVINLQSAATTLGITVTGTVDITGQLDVDDLTLNGSTVVSGTGEVLFGSHIRPNVDNALDLGGAGARFRTVFFDTALQTSTNQFLATELMALRNTSWRDAARTQTAQNNDILMYNNASGTFLSSDESQINHADLGGLLSGDAGHTQFVMLAGRTGGQVLFGGTAASEDLRLFNNSVDNDGLVIGLNVIRPGTDNVHSLGNGSYKFTDLHITGQAFGLRVENETAAGIGGKVSAGTPGRLFFNTEDDFLYVNDVAGAARKVGHNTYNATHTNVVLGSPVTTSGSIVDARNALWQLEEVLTGEIMNVPIVKTATQVTVSNTVPLPAGSYRLIGIEV